MCICRIDIVTIDDIDGIVCTEKMWKVFEIKKNHVTTKRLEQKTFLQLFSEFIKKDMKKCN